MSLPGPIFSKLPNVYFGPLERDSKCEIWAEIELFESHMGGVLGDHVVGAVIGSWPIKVELFETRRPQKMHNLMQFNSVMICVTDDYVPEVNSVCDR